MVYIFAYFLVSKLHILYTFFLIKFEAIAFYKSMYIYCRKFFICAHIFLIKFEAMKHKIYKVLWRDFFYYFN